MCVYMPDVPPIIKKAARQMLECIKEAGKPVAEAAVEYVKSHIGHFRKDRNGKIKTHS